MSRGERGGERRDEGEGRVRSKGREGTGGGKGGREEGKKEREEGEGRDTKVGTLNTKPCLPDRQVLIHNRGVRYPQAQIQYVHAPHPVTPAEECA